VSRVIEASNDGFEYATVRFHGHLLMAVVNSYNDDGTVNVWLLEYMPGKGLLNVQPV
jgi:hypothetical protein